MRKLGSSSQLRNVRLPGWLPIKHPTHFLKDKLLCMWMESKHEQRPCQQDCRRLLSLQTLLRKKNIKPQEPWQNSLTCITWNNNANSTLLLLGLSFANAPQQEKSWAHRVTIGHPFLTHPHLLPAIQNTISMFHIAIPTSIRWDS
jgi:hypothetical protein